MRICQACGFDRCDNLTTHCPQCGAKLSAPKHEVEEVSRNVAPTWFHYLEIPQVGIVALTPGQAFTIGKGTRCDLRLTQVRSDQLASFFWNEGNEDATVERHRTANDDEHIEVDGTRLTGIQVLKGTEELAIGPVLVVYLKRAKKILGAVERKKGRIGLDPSRAVVREGDDGTMLEPRSRRFNRSAVKKAATKRAPSTRRPSGPTPLDVALGLEKAQETGLLKVSSLRGSGWVSVLSGSPATALFGDLRGERAVAAILRQQNASAEFTPGAPEPEGGEAVRVSFSTVKRRLERHKAETQKLQRQPKPPTQAMRKLQRPAPAKRVPPPTQALERPPPEPPKPSWGDGARKG